MGHEEQRGVGHGRAERREQRGGSREEWVMREQERREQRGVGHEEQERSGS